MKKLLIIFLCFYTVTAFAEPIKKAGHGEAVPKIGFKDFAELNNWASTSSFGGGHAGRLQLSSKDVFYSDRMFTSGIPTSELIFYTKYEGRRINPFLVIPLQPKEFRVSTDEKGQYIIVKSYDRQEKKWHIALKISQWMLPLSAFHQ